MRFAELRITALFMGTFIALPVAAADWPTRTMTVVAPGGPGGTTDILARMLAANLSKDLGRAVIVENRSGGGTSVANQVVAKAKPDGHTLLLAAAAIAVVPHLYKSLAYDPLRDLQPVRLIARIPNVVVVNANSPVRTVKELVELLKKNPGKYNYASPGAGTLVHLGAELFKSMTMTDLVGVQYSSSAQSVAAVLSGEVLVAFENLPVALPHIQAGTLRAIAITSAIRSPNLPDIPTVAEAGIAGYDVSTWFGLMAPTGTPTEVIGRLDAATRSYLESPDTRARLRVMGAETATEGSMEFRQLVRSESEKWGAVIRKANIRVD